MDQVRIILPCGYETTYGSLQNVDNVIRCMICDDEDLNVKEILNRPRNRLRLKKKELQLTEEKFRLLSEQLDAAKQDPHFCVEKSFERIYNVLDIRREELKIEFEQKLDNYYMKLKSDLDAKKILTIEKLEQYQKTEMMDCCLDESLVNNSIDLNDKIESIESNLKQIYEKVDEVNEIVMLSELGEAQMLVFREDNIEIDKIFGYIESNLFDYEQKSRLKGHSSSIFVWKM